MRIDPHDEVGHNNLGVMLVGDQKYAEAMAEFQKALLCKPSYAMTYYNIGLLLVVTQHKAEAASAFRKALLLKPDYKEADDQLQKIIYSIH